MTQTDPVLRVESQVMKESEDNAPCTDRIINSVINSKGSQAFLDVADNPRWLGI